MPLVSRDLVEEEEEEEEDFRTISGGCAGARISALPVVR
jgi:hypothetical protein